MRRFLTTLMILLVVLVAGLSALVLLVNPNDFRDYMVKQVAARSGYQSVSYTHLDVYKRQHLTQAVIDWKASCERRFVFRPNEAITPADRQAVMAKMTAKRHRLESTLTVGATELQRFLSLIHI